MNGKRTYELPQAPRPQKLVTPYRFLYIMKCVICTSIITSLTYIYYIHFQHVVKCFLYIFKKNNFLLDKIVYSGIIVIRAPRPGLYIKLGYIQNTAEYNQFIAKWLLVTADYTSLYKVIIRKSLGARYIEVWVSPSVPCPPL